MNLVFIIGTGRCGSSLIHEVLAKHEHVGFISNIEDRLARWNLKGTFNNALFRTPLGRFTKKGRIRFSTSEAYKLISKQVSPIYANSSRNLEATDVTPWIARRCQSFFSERYKAQGKSIFTHKYTGWSRIGFFSKIFPEARFIHIIRDGRGVANSWLQMEWWGGYRGPENWLWGRLPEKYQNEWLESGQSFVVLSGIGWKILMDSYEVGSKALNKEQYLCVRYEDFLDKPRELITDILSFIEVQWTSNFEKHFRRQTVYSARSQSFRKDLSPEQLSQLETSLAEKLRQYGYIL